jgi:antitoxin HigA-1
MEVKACNLYRRVVPICEVNHVDDEALAGGEILREEFMDPMGLTQGALAEAMGVDAQACQRAVQRTSQCGRSDRAHPLRACVGNRPDFWLNVRRRSDLWEAMHSPRERQRIGSECQGTNVPAQR